MGYYVYTLISHSLNDTDNHNNPLDEKIKECAKRHLDRLTEEKWQTGEPKSECLGRFFLKAMCEDRLYNCGPKGGCIAYAATGNHTEIDQLVENLLPYFKDMWEIGAIFKFENVVIMCEPEQGRKVEICVIEGPEAEGRGRIYKAETYDFCWGQM